MNPKKIAIVGPESTGKSLLAAALADHFCCDFVDEMARPYLEQLDRPYTEDDLLRIAVAQCAEEDRLAATGNPVLVCDTTLLVIRIWSEVKYGRCHPFILEEEARRTYDAWLLTNIDLPWEEDPLREHPHFRMELFELYHAALLKKGVPFAIVRGSGEARTKNALNHLIHRGII